MAPTRKSKSVNKQYSSKYEVSPVKDAGNSRKSNPKKKLFDKLGSPWNKAEIERFYKAYRAYGKDWKKVAAAVRNRSTEMVEAFYSMNRAYLSLPDGVASVIGLIAMMTDHYSVLGGSDVERESNEPSEIPLQTQKRKRVKTHFGSSKEDGFLPQSVASSQGCLPLLERIGFNGINPHAVRRRTPRVPVSYSYRRDDIESYDPPKKRVKKSEAGDNDNEHVTAVTLSGSLQRGRSPQFSQKHHNKDECRKSTTVQSYDHMFIQPETTKAKHPGSSCERRMAIRLGAKEPVIGTYRRGTFPMESMEGATTGEVHRKGKKIYQKKVKVDEIMNNISDDGEACSGTEEGITNTVQGKVDMDISSSENKLSPWSQRKKNNKIVSGDESDSLDALLTLANLSTSMLPTSTVESESSAKLKEDKTTRETEEKSSASVGHHSNITKHLRPKEKLLNLITEAEDDTSRKSKVGRYSATVDNVVFESKQQPEPINNSKKRKSKSFSTSQLQISNPEAPIDSPFIQSFDNEAIAEEVDKSLTKGKCGAESSVQSRQWKPFRVPEDSPTNNDPKIAETDPVVSTLQVPAEPKLVSLPNKHQSRRKMNLKRALVSRDKNYPKYTVESNIPPFPFSKRENLSSCLSSSLARRWCSFEWFYSVIDYPWFAKKEFVEYLNHVGLGHIPRLTRVVWGVIRSSLGKPRRFSERFLYEEREKLKQYRESVRQHYAQLCISPREGLPTDLARPLSVGQQVIAIHPKTREVNGGKVLGVEHDSFRVQFDSPKLGVELVMDIDCMPLNPFENLPETLRKQNLAFDKFPATPNEYQVNGHSDFGGSGVHTPSVHPENATSPANMLANPIKVDASRNVWNAKTAVPNVVSAHQAANDQPLAMEHIQGREADIRVMSELNRALDKKEAILMELRNTNNDKLENRNGGSCLKGSEPFKKHIATVLVRLKEANGQVSSALHNLRQCNSYPVNPILPQQKSPPNSNFIGGLASSIDCSPVSQESDSVAGEIVEGSRLKAGSMVDAAIKAMSSTKDDEDAFMRVVEALDSIDKPQFTPDIRMPLTKSTEPENGSISYQKHLVSGFPQNNEQVPCELITSCVATLLMIQTCTERQYPPADVAQIIDSAVSSLHPWSTENLRIYREIQRCMGRIKTQILALIPT
ncbi:ARABIDOPSIS THALIANA ALWAYS EARLY 3, ALWAYS EARLY 3 [Hibiscus trionum]|uniref:ARABIDOPSIS THALIANA ALWAYS EARLY 3, ALWAYS EARLY 3 n=1 Tax=Hibiscus trionum TaxID=183268 RepID=A0A9W7M3Z4_HIBTR|nr:ARABIDOPSIS THALIANA ALWAYS EARLY 3, ALWAYS EARLY 3 [Hibiscus trionum]